MDYPGLYHKRPHDGSSSGGYAPGGGDGSASKRQYATVSMVVTHELAGAVIGPKGATLGAIR